MSEKRFYVDDGLICDREKYIEGLPNYKHISARESVILLNDLYIKNRVKSTIIQDLLWKYIKSLALKYDDYFQIIDNNMLSDEEMYVYIDRWNKSDCDDVYGNPISDEAYKNYLKDYKKKCDEFIEMLQKELHCNLVFSNSYCEITDEDYGDEVFYESCELHFRIEV